MGAVTPPSWAGTVGGAVCGAVFLTWMAGRALLDPTSIEWLMKLDWVPHYFGWFYFRTEPWQWPPGRISGYYAPLGTSIGLTDAIPLAAYVLKPLARWLPPHFQYIGPWWLLCFTLQGALGARLVARATPHAGLQILGGGIFVLVPTLLARIGHAALCSHWLVLWALLVATRAADRRVGAIEWALLGLCAGLVQPYLAAMALPLLVATAIDAGGVPAAARLRAGAAAAIATLVGWWLSGLFQLEGEGSLSAGGLGYYSMNLLAPITPGGWSRMLPALPVASPGQTYEGFHYLGLGVLALLAAAGGVAVWARTRREPRPPMFGPALRVVALLMTAFAISPTVTLGATVLLDVNSSLLAPLATFRSSGRFFWPLTYVLVAWAVATVVRRLPPATAGAVLIAAIGLQVYDLQDAYAARRATARDPGFQQWTQPFRSPEWDTIGLARHLVLVPPPQCGAALVPYEAAVRLAADHGMSVNAGVIARGDVGARQRYCAALEAEIRANRLESGRVYLVDAATAQALTGALGERVRCVTHDGLWTCVAMGREQLRLLP
jgi:hypothetical protein